MKNIKKRVIILCIICFIVLVGALVADKILSKPHLIKLEYDEVMEKIENKESFILVVSQTTCPHCSEYKPVIRKVLKDNDLIAYYVEFDTFSDDEKKEFNSIINFDSTPMTVFLKNGEETTVATRIVGAKNEEYILAKLKSNGYIDE